MSAFVVYMERGVKMMRPVTSLDEYLALRNSEQNRRADKKHMLQMNYSCLPTNAGEGREENANLQAGPLKGSTIPSNSVGMDIDLDATANENENQSHAIRDLILDKKEELGLLMLEASATKGYHLAFRRHPELTQEENLKWAASVLGVEYDQAAKDITRVFYTPADKLVYVDEELFVIERAPQIPTSTSPSPTQRPTPTLSCEGREENTEVAKEGVEDKGFESAEKAQAASLKAFDLCVKQAGLNPEAMDVFGEHNWHTNLMSVLSVGLPKLMNKEQLLATVAERLPNYWQSPDCKKLINYFYEKYSAERGFMTSALREINAKAQLEAGSLNADAQDEQDMAQLAEGWTPPELPKKVPRIMNLLTNNYDERFRPVLMLAALPVLSAHASHFKAAYLNGKITGCQQFVFTVGSSASGKSNCTALFKEMVEHTLNANDEHEWEKVRENAELRDKKANAKEKPPKYHPRLRLFETTSKSSILELQTNLGKNGMLLGQFSEVDGLSGASRAAYSDISVILRKGWDGDMHRQFYMNSDNTCNTYTNMNISLLVAGTVRAMLERMFSDSNCEGGLMQRFVPVLMPKGKRTFRPPMMNLLSEEEKAERDALLMQLYTRDLALGDEIEVLDLPQTNKAIGEWFDSLEERYNDGLLTDAEADLSHRCGEFMLRAAIPLVALYGSETREIVDFARWVGEIAFYNMCHIFGQRVQRDLNAANELLNQKQDERKTAQPLLTQLPNVFTLKEFKELRVKMGQSEESKMLLTRYCKSGKLERVGRGVYKKVGSL